MTLTENEAIEEVAGLSSSDIDFLREKAKNDLFFLSLGILGYKDVNPFTHGQFCRFIERQEKVRRLALMPRGHLKSTIGTIADSIRLALRDPADTRILVASETATLAEKFLAEIKGHFEKNQLLRALFPEVLPQRFSGPGVQWSAMMASLARPTAHKEPTWQAVGVGGSIVGSHFTRIKCDDLIGFEALRSPAKMAEAKAWIEYIEPLLVTVFSDIIDYIGTRWSKNDLYARVMEYYGDALAVFTRAAIEDVEGVPTIIFPAKYSWDNYRRIQVGNPALWFAQYVNNPLSGAASDLKWDRVRRFKFSRDGEWVLYEEGQWHLSQLDIMVLADPNSGSLTAPDTAAVGVQAMSPKGETFQLSSWSDRPDPTNFVDRIFADAKRWRARGVAIEKAGQQNTRHYFEKKCRDEHYHIPVYDLEPKGRKKEDRIRYLLGPVIRNDDYYILASQTILNQQGADFPDTILIDELDIAAYGQEVLRQPDARTVAAKKSRAALIAKLMSRRSVRTGY